MALDGDIVYKDEEGYLFIVDGRSSHHCRYTTSIPGKWTKSFIAPQGAGRLRRRVPDIYRGETVKAFVVLKPGETATEKEIVNFCKEKLAAYKVPKYVEFRQALPQTAVGKILRRVLRDEEIAARKAK